MKQIDEKNIHRRLDNALRKQGLRLVKFRTPQSDGSRFAITKNNLIEAMAGDIEGWAKDEGVLKDDEIISYD